jgi:23S rRNA (guanine2445-N2)-methyltransferase / 23S rRNA (guanine2069-N7)-methyltransferase
MAYPPIDFDRYHYLATAARGTEPALESELKELGIPQLRVVPGGIEFRAPIEMAMRVCLWSRIANRVLIELGRDTIRNERQIYPSVRALTLGGWFSPDHTIAVSFQARGEVVKNSMFGALVVKDALVDFIRETTTHRPNVDRENPDVRFAVINIDSDIRYYIELSGQTLNQRGYRLRDVRAPLKETLAAALIRYSRWNGRTAFIDPFCGSGTLAIEAALMATDTAPGIARPMGFESWPCFADRLQPAWRELRNEAEQRRGRKIRGVIAGSDRDMVAIAAARANANQTGIDGIVFRQADALQLEPILGNAQIVCNPPYGERIGGDASEIEQLMKGFALAWKKLEGHPLTMIAPDASLKAFGVKPTRFVKVSNGKLPCKFAHFER